MERATTCQAYDVLRLNAISCLHQPPLLLLPYRARSRRTRAVHLSRVPPGNRVVAVLVGCTGALAFPLASVTQAARAPAFAFALAFAVAVAVAVALAVAFAVAVAVTAAVAVAFAVALAVAVAVQSHLQSLSQS